MRVMFSRLSLSRRVGGNFQTVGKINSRESILLQSRDPILSSCQVIIRQTIVLSGWATKVSEISRQARLGAESFEESNGRKSQASLESTDLKLRSTKSNGHKFYDS